MLDHPAFAGGDAWTLRETSLHLDLLAQTESVFALSNGHIGMRGNLDEGEPAGIPGTYLNGCYELRPLPYAEAGYGNPESSQTLVNVTNGKIMRLLVNDALLDLRMGKLLSHERVLDVRAGTLERTLEWQSPHQRRVKVHSTRLVSLSQRAVAAIAYEVEAVDEPIRVVVQSELVANEATPSSADDPRAAAILDTPLVGEGHATDGTRGMLIHSTQRSRLRLAAVMDHIIDSPPGGEVSSESHDDVARLTAIATLQPGQKLRLVKFLAYGWSSRRSSAALQDQVAAALAAARHTGWEGLLADQRAYLDKFWQQADVELDGDPPVQQAVRVALFHVLQAGARAEVRAIPAKGLTGPGYDGHSFWDTETFVLPVLTYTSPEAASDALRWRHSTLDQARDRARQLQLDGAVFPWRTIAGAECSAYWPAGTAAFHLQADIAAAVLRYQAATDDADFEREVGLEILAETARLWNDLGHHAPDGHFRIDGVTGPDEYSAIADNNIYTNLMAQRNLRGAADSAERQPERAAALGITTDELADWRRAADAMAMPFDERFGVHPQSENYSDHEIWDFASTKPDEYPLFLHFPYFDLYSKQVLKQADLVLALHLCGDSFSDEEKARDFAYYEALTVRDSSLSASTQSVVAAEIGQMDLAYDYLGEAALIDLDDVQHNTRDGLHLASLAGTWSALVAGLGGMRDHGGRLSFKPRLPSALSRLVFNLRWRGQQLRVEVSTDKTIYRLRRGDGFGFRHYATDVELRPGQILGLPIPPLSVPLRPIHQPLGRAPDKRTPQAQANDDTAAGASRPGFE